MEGKEECQSNYEVPEFVKLIDEINKLRTKLDGATGRYISPLYVELCDNITKLHDQYKAEKNAQKAKRSRLSSWSSFWDKTETRFDQILLLLLIMNSLSKDSKETEASHQILLGAILYRYTRLYREHKTASAKSGCMSLAVLIKLLKIDGENKIDNTTLYTCCTAFKTFLQSIDPEGKSIYQRFAYVTKDPEFFKKLDHIIDKADKSTDKKIMDKNIEYLNFIESITKQIEQYYAGVKDKLILLYSKIKPETTLDAVKKLIGTLGFLPKVAKTIEDLLDHLQNFDEGENFVKITKENYSDFHLTLNNFAETYFRSTLLGVLAVCDQMEISTELNMLLRAAMNDRIDNVLTPKHIRRSCGLLKKFIENVAEVEKLNLTVWHNQKKLIACLEGIINQDVTPRTERGSMIYRPAQPVFHATNSPTASSSEFTFS